MKLTWCRPGMAILLIAGAMATARAQEDNAGHGVARISIINGDVSVQRGDSGERSAAAVNAPVAVGDIVATAPGARTEVQFDSANMVRLASDSEIRLSELSRNRFQFQVGRGTVIFSVVRDSHAQVEISTPSVSIRPLSTRSPGRPRRPPPPARRRPRRTGATRSSPIAGQPPRLRPASPPARASRAVSGWGRTGPVRPGAGSASPAGSRC